LAEITVSILDGLAYTYAIAGLGYWLTMLVFTLRSIRAIPVLDRWAPREPDSWPTLSQIVPACNEAATLEAAVGSRLREGYPDTEIMLVEDRSTDATPAIADQLAAADPRVQVLHLVDLPAGWLGKVHALHQGTQRATGEWLLFSDADVHFSPGAIRRAVAYALAHNLDHLTLVPDLWPATFCLDACLSSFLRVFGVVTRSWAVNDPLSRASLGVGAFNLVRRAAFERTPGFEWLRLEVVDDMAFGQMLKRSGARTALVNGCGLVGLWFYRSLAEAARGTEKGAPAAARNYGPARAALAAVVLAVLEVAPLACVLAWGRPWVQWSGALSVAAALVAQLALARRNRRPLLSAACIPLAAVLNLVLVLRAAWLCWRRGGLVWRGTLYPLDVLRAGRRLEFP
jgi:hypothetical protein